MTQHDKEGLPADLLTSKTVGVRRLKVENDPDSIPKNFKFEVAKGNVPGNEYKVVVARNPSTESTAFEDLWGGGELPVPELNMVYPTTAETWEIVSDSADDAAAGAGTRDIAIASLDENLLEQLQIVTMNGTTPVTLTGTHLRPDGMLSLSSGANGNNVGLLTLRVSGGGNARNIALPNIGRSHDCHYTVPSDKDAYILTTQILFPKDGSGKYMNQFRPSTADASWVTGSVLLPYQDSISFPFESLPKILGGNDVRLQVQSDSGARDVTTIFELLLVDKII